MHEEDFEGMPSGADHGALICHGYVDNRDFTAALFVKEATKDNEKIFSWVVEAANGDFVLLKHAYPMHGAVFGVDRQEWLSFISSEAIPAIDNYLASKQHD